MENKPITRGGFVQIIVLAVVIIAVLAYLNVDLRAFFDKPIVHNFVNIFVVGWGAYIKPFLLYLVSSITGLFK